MPFLDVLVFNASLHEGDVILIHITGLEHNCVSFRGLLVFYMICFSLFGTFLSFSSLYNLGVPSPIVNLFKYVQDLLLRELA